MFLMDKVFYMKKRKKGAISIFLILIFLATFMLSAVLVDGGRYRMAQVMAESALDSAGQSVLSYYNQMLYDLYGLMAVDPESVSQEQIAQVLEDYVNKTLAAAEIDDDAYVSTLTEFLLDGSMWQDNDTEYFDDFDFTVSIGGEQAGTSLTLASTDYVEDQIVDYMKYRAPLQMSGIDGFLGKLNAITAIKDSLVASKELNSATKSNKSLFEDGDALKTKIDSFVKKVISYCNDTDATPSESSYLCNVTENLGETYGNAFHTKIDGIANRTPDPVPTMEDGVPLTQQQIKERKEAAEAKLHQEQAADYASAKTAFVQTDLAKLFSNAQTLKAEADQLLSETEAINARYQSYIQSLSSTMNAHSGSDAYQVVFEPAVAEAKGQCGEILRGRIPLLAASFLLNQLQAQDKAALQNRFGALTPGSPDEIKSAADQFLTDAQGRLSELCTEASAFYASQVDPPKEEVDSEPDISAEPEADEVEEPKTPTGFDNEDDLEVAYTQAPAPTLADMLSDLDLDTGGNKKVDITKIFDAGLNLVDSLLSMMAEGVRDNIYVNEYIMTTFPNIVDEQDYDPSTATKLQQKRHEYNATNAGEEYILVGKADAEDNVNGAKARLLGVRTIFNTVAIFTDTAKRNQAMALASAIPTPAAPVLTVVILIGWAVAESAIDVAQLMNGEEVPLFKSGSAWTLSIENALNKCVEAVVDKAGEVVTDTVGGLLEGFHEQISNQANQAINDIYNGAVSSVDSALETVKGRVTGLKDSAVSDAGQLLGQFSQSFDQAANALKDQAMTKVQSWSGGIKDQAIKAVGDSLDQAFTGMETALSEKFSQLGEEAKAQLKGKIGEYLDASQLIGDKAGVDLTSAAGQAVLDMSYGDYMRVFLLMMNQDKKVQRIQSLIQANMIHGGNEGFRMEDCAVSVWADMDCEIRYLFMENAVLPDKVRRNGRMSFTVHSAVSY